MQPSDLHNFRLPLARVPGLVALCGHNLKLASLRKRLIVLRNLIALRQIRIEIVLPREDRAFINVQPQSERRPRAQLNRATIQNRKRPRQSQTYRTSVRIRLVPEPRRAPTKNLRLRTQLSMNLKTNYRLPTIFHKQLKNSDK